MSPFSRSRTEKKHKISIMPQHKYTEHSAGILYTLLVCSFQKKQWARDLRECCKDDKNQRRASKPGINRAAAPEMGEKGHD